MGNIERAEHARVALSAYLDAAGEAFDTLDANVTDLIVDLLHLLYQETGIPSVDAFLHMAQIHYETELKAASVGDLPVPQSLIDKANRHED